MTDYTVPQAKHATLAAGVVDSVTLTLPPFTYGSGQVEVFNHGSTDTIWFTNDGATPTVKGDNAYFVKPNTGLTVPLRRTSSGNAAIKLLCAGSCDYSVTAA